MIVVVIFLILLGALEFNCIPVYASISVMDARQANNMITDFGPPS